MKMNQDYARLHIIPGGLLWMLGIFRSERKQWPLRCWLGFCGSGFSLFHCDRERCRAPRFHRAEKEVRGAWPPGDGNCIVLQYTTFPWSTLSSPWHVSTLDILIPVVYYIHIHFLQSSLQQRRTKKCVVFQNLAQILLHLLSIILFLNLDCWIHNFDWNDILFLSYTEKLS